jgi:glycosyltransferase involved in cell wall biosynthesis
MPVYNTERFVAQTTESVLAQTFNNFELIAIDDGSTDRSHEILEGFSKRDPRVRVVSRANKGLVATLNEGLTLAQGSLVARMDADDLVLPGRFRRELRAIESGADAVFTTVVTWGSGAPALPRPSGIDASDFGMHLLLTNPVAHSTLLARRESIIGAGGYRDLPTEDYDLWLRMAARGARICRLGTPGLAYRVHPDQVTASAEWRLSSWRNAELAASYSTLAEQLIGAPATRITSLSIDDRLRRDQKLAEFDRFATRFDAALVRHGRSAQRALRRKLHERRSWLVAHIDERRAATG